MQKNPSELLLIPLLTLLLALNIRSKSLLQFLDGDFSNHGSWTTLSAGGKGNAADDVDDAVLADSVFKVDGDVAVDDDRGPALPGVDVDSEALFKEGRELDVEVAVDLGLVFLVGFFIAVVDLVAVDGGVGDDLVLEQSGEILLASLSVEEEGCKC
jgi:hypothetical protein